MATPFETGSNNQPISWVGVNQTLPDGRIPITIAGAASTYPGDNPVFSAPLTQTEAHLLVAAADLWEEYANVQFLFVTDVASNQAGTPDIRVSLADLNSGVGQPSMGFITGETAFRASNDHFLSDTVVTVDDPTEHPVTALADGDLRYNGSTATMFQTFLHELGHAIGLAHNQTDPTSIMSPTLSSRDPLPDSQDIAAVQALYGASSQPPSLSLSETNLLTGLTQAAQMGIA